MCSSTPRDRLEPDHEINCAPHLLSCVSCARILLDHVVDVYVALAAGNAPPTLDNDNGDSGLTRGLANPEFRRVLRDNAKHVEKWPAWKRRR